MSDAYVIGVDMIKFGRFPERSVPELGAEAVRKLHVKDFPLFVVNDLYRGDLYEEGVNVYAR